MSQRSIPYYRPLLERLEDRIVPSHKPGHGGGGSPLPPPEYNLSGLGVLAGHNESTAMDVNSAGMVVGQSWFSGTSGAARAFLVIPRDVNGDGTADWYANAGSVPNSTNELLMIELMTITGPSLSHSIARGINEAGQAVGAYVTTNGESHAFLITANDMNSDGNLDWNWDANSDGTNDLMTDLGNFGGTRAAAFDVNNKGQVVGSAQDASGNMLPFLWNPTVPNGATGQIISLGTFGALGPWESDTMATGINESGQVVGKVLILESSNWYGRGFIITPQDVDNDGTPDWTADANSDGKNDLMMDLGVLTNQTSEASAINDGSVIVGEAGSNISRIWGHAVRWTPQAGLWSIADLGGLHGQTYHSFAHDINNSGVSVGYSQQMVRSTHNKNNVLYEPVGERRAFVYDGNMKALDTLVSSMAGFTYLNDARAISDARHIVGEGKVGAARHAFIAVPVLSAMTAEIAGPGSTAVVTVAQLQRTVTEAMSRRAAAGVDVSALTSGNLRIANLGGAALGLAAGNTIWLDDNAAGWDWFVDPTPWDDSEFTTPGDPLTLPSPQSGRGDAGNTMDLLTALAHEIGHLLGHDHGEPEASATGDVMINSLATGIRRMPGATEVGDWSALVDFMVAAPLSKRNW